MGSRTCIAACIFWMVVALGTTAFLAWYNLGDPAAVSSASDGSALVRAAEVLAAPLLLFALGAVIGLLFVLLKDVTVAHGIKVAARIATAVGLIAIAAAGVGIAVAPAGSDLPPITVVVTYVSMMAPLLFIALGALHGIGLAPQDASRP